MRDQVHAIVTVIGGRRGRRPEPAARIECEGRDVAQTGRVDRRLRPAGPCRPCPIATGPASVVGVFALPPPQPEARSASAATGRRGLRRGSHRGEGEASRAAPLSCAGGRRAQTQVELHARGGRRRRARAGRRRRRGRCGRRCGRRRRIAAHVRAVAGGIGGRVGVHGGRRRCGRRLGGRCGRAGRRVGDGSTCEQRGDCEGREHLFGLATFPFTSFPWSVGAVNQRPVRAACVPADSCLRSRSGQPGRAVASAVAHPRRRSPRACVPPAPRSWRGPRAWCASVAPATG